MTTTPDFSQFEPPQVIDSEAVSVRTRPAPPAAPPVERPAVPERDKADALDLLAVRQRPTAERGWRRLVAKVTAGRINPGPSKKQDRESQVIENIRVPLTSVHKVAFVSSKGGVGKSTMTVALGNTLASLRGDRVIAVDVDADLGDLAARFSEQGGPLANIEKLAALENAERYSNVRVHTLVNKDRLELLGSQNDPRSTYRFGPEDFVSTMQILDIHCNVILLDCGTPINDPLFGMIARDVGSLVVVASEDVRGVEGALATLDWLAAHGHTRLLQHTVVALNAIHKGKPLIDREAVENQFKKRVPAVFRVPYDPHLATGVAVDSASLKGCTRKALLALAGGLAQYYPGNQSRRPPPENDLGAWIDVIRNESAAGTP